MHRTRVWFQAALVCLMGSIAACGDDPNPGSGADTAPDTGNSDSGGTNDGGNNDIWCRRVLPVSYLGMRDADNKIAGLWKEVSMVTCVVKCVPIPVPNVLVLISLRFGKKAARRLIFLGRSMTLGPC